MSPRSPYPPPAEGTAHPGLLLEIASNTLDQDYLAAARRPRPAGGQRRSSGPMLVVVVLLFGAMLGISALRTEQQRPIAQAERDQLVSQIHDRQARLDDLHAQLAALEAAVARLQSSSSQDRTTARLTDASLTQLAGITGAGAVTGPGLRIVADDAPGAVGGAVGGVILDSDLQSLVNALWTAGAEAISINGHRLTSLSAIRFAGQAITVDYRSLMPPYVVEAIGDPDTLPARLLETPGGQAWLGLKTNYGIRFDPTTSTSLQLPGDPGAQIRQATAVTSR